MTDATIITVVTIILAAVPTTIASLIALKTANKNGLKADALIVETAKIHTLANNNLSAVNKSLEIANEKINGLQTLVAELAKTREVAAAVAAAAIRPSAPAAPAPSLESPAAGGAVVKSLKRIDENTAAIEQNTAKTEADVKVLKDGL